MNNDAIYTWYILPYTGLLLMDKTIQESIKPLNLEQINQ